MRAELLIGIDFRRRALGLAASVTLIGAIAPGTANAIEGSSVRSTPTMDCINPTSKDLKSVGTMLAAPEAAVFDIDEKTRAVTPRSKPEDFKAAEQAAKRQKRKQHNFRKNIALKYGLETHDADHYIELLEDGLRRPDGSTSSFGSYLSTVNAFMNKLGVTVSLADGNDLLAYGAKVLQPSDVETATAKVSAINILRAYNNVPREYTAISGLKHIKLVSQISGYAAYADMHSNSHDSYYLGIKPEGGNSVSTQTILHEDHHMIDRSLCGPYDGFGDASFQDIDGSRYIYSVNYKAPTLLDYNELTSRNDSKLQNAEKMNDSDTYCKIVEKEEKEAARVATYSEFHPSAVEEKAEIGSEIANPFAYAKIANPKLTVLYKKFRFLLGRLNHVNPGLATYFLRTSRRPEIDEYAEQHC